MVHFADEGAEISEHTLDLRGISKLEFLVDVDLVAYLPPIIDSLVNACPIRVELAFGLYPFK